MKHGIGERILPRDQIKSLNELVLFERHHFAYTYITPMAKDKKVLEIGCGTAYDTHEVSRNSHETIALDIDPELIERLKQNETEKLKR